MDGTRLRELRQERALSLRELGDMTGVAFDTINKLELGKREEGIVKCCGLGPDHAASFSRWLPSISSPLTNLAPALTSATR